MEIEPKTLEVRFVIAYDISYDTTTWRADFKRDGKPLVIHARSVEEVLFALRDELVKTVEEQDKKDAA